MRSKRIAEVKEEVSRSEERLDRLLKSLSAMQDKQGRAFDLSAVIPATDTTVSDIRARHAALAGLVRKMDRKGGEIVPAAFFQAVSNALRSVGNAADQIEAEISTIEGWQGLANFNYDNFVATAANGQQRDFSGPFKAFNDGSEAYLTAFHSLFQAVNPSRASFNFSAATEALSKIISRATDARNDLAKALDSATSALAKIKSQEERLGAIVSQADANSSSISEQLGRSTSAMAEVEAHRDRITEILKAAEEMDDAVEAYGESFEKFSDEMDRRNSAYEKGVRSLETLSAELIEQKEFIRTLIEQSDNMLSGATVAGLASEFKNLRDELTTQLAVASKVFYGSIGFLFLCALPLIVFIFAPILAPLMTDNEGLIGAIAAAGTEKSGWQYVGQVIARFVILLPGIWLVTFATGRYNSLFRLREHYSYKYSMAVAVDGFKKQAPGHEDLVAALVFEQLAFNPADKLGKQVSKDTSDAPSPISKLLMNYLQKKSDELE